MLPLVPLVPVGTDQLHQVNQRLNYIEDMISDILEGGREMDANLTAQLSDVQHQIEMQHETIKKMGRSSCRLSHVQKFAIIIVVFVVSWVLLSNMV